MKIGLFSILMICGGLAAESVAALGFIGPGQKCRTTLEDKCFTGYLGNKQECYRGCCATCGTFVPNIRTVARFTVQKKPEPILWYGGVPYYYGHSDRYHYCKYQHDVGYYYSCNCCVLMVERIVPCNAS